MLNNTLKKAVYKSTGFLCNHEGSKLLRQRQKQLTKQLGENVTYRYISNCIYVSQGTIKNFFNPQLQRRVSKLNIEIICQFLQIEPLMIIDDIQRWNTCLC